MNRKILLSLGVLVFVGALAMTATGAFFSDSETSTGNILAAGSIDLMIDNTSYVTSTTTGELVASPNTTWTMRNITVEKFFDFTDVKPGDIGEDTISLHVDNNDSYLCADITLTSNNENSLVDPESDDGDVSTTTGELANQVNFAWWADDGDNVLEVGENLLQGGPLGALAIGATTSVALADSDENIWTGQGGPIPGSSTRYVGKAWCYGTITPTPVAQDGSASSSPLIRGTGFTCDGTNVDNTGQTDSFTADVAFRAVQSRNNGSFQCTPTVPTEPTTGTLTVTKIVVNDDNGTATTSDFALFVDGMSVTSGVATTTSSGSHVVSETGVVGYTGTIGGDCDVNGNVNVPAGGVANCTITNNDNTPETGTVTLDKVVTFTNLAVAGVDVSDYTLHLVGPGGDHILTDEVAFPGLTPGAYVVSEVYSGDPANATSSVTFSGSCTEIGTTDTATLNVVSGVNPTCTITNSVSTTTEPAV